MLKFHKSINKTENILGVYISSTVLDTIAQNVIMYFRDLFIGQQVRSPLQQPIIMQFDPTLANNRLEIKVSINAIKTITSQFFISYALTYNSFLFLDSQHSFFLDGKVPNVQ